MFDSSYLEDHSTLISKPHTRVVTHLEWSNRSDELLSVAYDSTVRCLNVETGAYVQKFATYGTESVCDRFKDLPGYGVDEGHGYFFQVRQAQPLPSSGGGRS